MRIAEISALAGVTSRAVRHYHHVGLLPEPARRPNGYRDYSVRDAVLLARIRRLTELGLSLDEVRDVLADDAGRELTEVLGELDADLARQEAQIRARRRRLAELMETPPTDGGPVSPELARFLHSLPAVDSPSAAMDRDLLTLLDRHGYADDGDAEDGDGDGDGDGDKGGTADGGGSGSAGAGSVYDALRPLATAPEMLGLYRRLDELVDAPADDPRIGPLADDLSALLTDELVAALPAGDGPPVDGFGDALLAEYSPAQARVVRLIMESLSRRTRDRGPVS
ncbi:MerR family transcriptional regulator [Streptomyces sp. NPDC059255]|uniref:MerR family transcriptional regulator n=1 Tax=Streptomyces sp. NPDC059255 TaxID=3346793 RepID=UPI00368A9A90